MKKETKNKIASGISVFGFLASSAAVPLAACESTAECIDKGHPTSLLFRMIFLGLAAGVIVGSGTYVFLDYYFLNSPELSIDYNLQSSARVLTFNGTETEEEVNFSEETVWFSK